VETDYRKYFESSQPGAGLRTVEDTASPEALEHTTAAPVAASQPAAVAQADEDPTAVTFPYNFLIRLIMYGAVAGGFGYVAHTAFTGDPERDLGKILIGCAAVIGALCFLPGSIVLDRRGVHQVYCMGLYEYSIPTNAILSYRHTTRGELRREGKLKFSWGNARYNRDQDDEHDQVVVVTGKYGGRYILHTAAHRGQYTFIEELEKRGVPAHGYEGWTNFMADRGFPPAEGSR
jgi:hypothetical protein